MLATSLPFTATVLITFTVAMSARRPFGECVAASLYGMSVVMYLSGYFLGFFTPGICFLYIIAALAVPLFFLRNGGPAKNREYILSNGLWAYIGCLVVVSLMDAGRNLYSWDELMHWGKMVKEMLRLDRFYCVPQSTLYRHKDYPPFIALFEYAWCRLGRKYSEPHVAQAIHLLNVSLIVPIMFEQFRSEKKRTRAPEYVLKGILATAIVLMVCSFCDPNTNINSIYEDITIGLMFAYSGFLIYRKSYRSIWGQLAYLLSLVALIGTKQIGIAFIGLSLLYLALSVLFLEKEAKQKRAGIFCALAAAVAAGAYYLSWNGLLALYPSERQFELGSNISLSVFVQRLTDSTDRVHRDMLKRFVFALFDRDIASGPIVITYFTSFFVVLLILIALGYRFRNEIALRERIILGSVFTVGEGGYAMMMLMLYELCFESEEMESMHSFVRYMGSYFLAELMLLLMIAVWLWGRENPIWQRTTKMCIAFMLAAVLVVPGKLTFLVPQGIRGDRLFETRQRGEFLTEHVPEGSTIYLAYERSEGDKEQIRYSYFVDGSWIDHSYYSFSSGSLSENTKKSFEETLRRDDYLYTLEVTKGMKKVLSDYSGGQDIKEYTLYEITEATGTITLKEVTNG